MRWVDDPETGERVRKEVPVRFRPWYWKDEQGTFTRHNDSTQLASDLEAFEIMRIVSSPRLAHSTPQCLVDFQKGLERSSLAIGHAKRDLGQNVLDQPVRRQRLLDRLS